MGQIDLATFRNSSIENIEILNSNIDFILFNSLTGIIGNTIGELSFTFKNVSYKDCSITDKRDLFKFSEMKTDQNFTISLEEILFSNISFATGGNLIMFSQQLSNGIVIRNSTFQDIVAGTIKIKPIDKM